MSTADQFVLKKPPVITRANSSMVGNPYLIGITEELLVIRAESLGMIRDIKQRTSIYATPVRACLTVLTHRGGLSAGKL